MWLIKIASECIPWNSIKSTYPLGVEMTCGIKSRRCVLVVCFAFQELNTVNDCEILHMSSIPVIWFSSSLLPLCPWLALHIAVTEHKESVGGVVVKAKIPCGMLLGRLSIERTSAAYEVAYHLCRASERKKEATSLLLQQWNAFILMIVKILCRWIVGGYFVVFYSSVDESGLHCGFFIHLTVAMATETRSCSIRAGWKSGGRGTPPISSTNRLNKARGAFWETKTELR